MMMMMMIRVCALVERRGRAAKAEADTDVRSNLIYTATESEDGVRLDDIPRGSQHRPRTTPDDGPPHSKEHRSRATADKSRPVPKPRSASTSSTLEAAAPGGKPSTPSLDRSLEADMVKPRPRARASQESLDRSFDDPQSRPRLGGSQESLDRSFDKPVAKHRPRGGSVESLERLADRQKPDRPTPAMRRSQESLEGVDDRPIKPRARGSLDRSLDHESDASTSQKPSRPPPVAVKQGRKAANRGKDRAAISSDETDV